MNTYRVSIALYYPGRTCMTTLTLTGYSPDDAITRRIGNRPILGASEWEVTNVRKVA